MPKACRICGMNHDPGFHAARVRFERQRQRVSTKPPAQPATAQFTMDVWGRQLRRRRVRVRHQGSSRVLGVPLAPSSLDWPQGYRDEVNSAASPLTLSENPTLIWAFSGVSDEGATLHPDSGQAIVGAWLYTSADHKPGAGDSRSQFSRFRAATGEKTWVYDPDIDGAKHDGLVCVDLPDNLVIYGAHDGNLRALDLDTGELVWRLALPGQPEGGVTLVDGTALYLAQNYLYAIDPARTEIVGGGGSVGAGGYASPVIKWKVARRPLPVYGVASKPIVANGMVFWGESERFHATRLSDGSEVWTRSTGLENWTYGFSIPHYHNGRVYVTASWSLDNTAKTLATAYHPNTGAVIWEQTHLVDFAVKSAVDAQNGLLIMGYKSQPDNVPAGVIAFRLSDGSEAWRFLYNFVKDFAGVAGGSGGVWGATGTYGYVIAATTTDGETGRSVEITVDVDDVTKKVTLTWTRPTPPNLTVNGYKIYRTATPGTYTAPCRIKTINSAATVSYVDDGSGGLSGSPSGGGFTNSGPVVSANGLVVVAQSTGIVRLLRTATGEEIWAWMGSDTMHGAISMARINDRTCFCVPANNTLRLFG